MYPLSLCKKNKSTQAGRSLARMSSVVVLCFLGQAACFAGASRETDAPPLTQEKSMEQGVGAQLLVVSQAGDGQNTQARSEGGTMVVSLAEPIYTSVDGDTTPDPTSNSASDARPMVARVPYAVEVAVIALLGLVIVARRRWNGPR
jgi:hypothetical protein